MNSQENVSKESILTFCRTNDKIKAKHPFKINNHSIEVNGKQFKVDYVMENKSQAEVFSVVRNFVVQNAQMGYNCTVFAYGQTGSGKTYTIRGTSANLGLIPRALEYLHSVHKSIKLSFIEIYNEIVTDLSIKGGETLNIREVSGNKNSSVLVENLTVFESANFKASMDFYTKGIKNRKIAHTRMNDVSSRSHTIFNIELELMENGVHKTSKLTFVDLAGSEKLKDSSNDTIVLENMKQFKETTNINKSLLYLGIIVNALGKKDIRHVPYRDSKLTFLLKDSLGGNSKLCMIGNINLAYSNDSINTLQFLQRVKMITNKPAINYDIFDEGIKEVLEALEQENRRLREQVSIYKEAAKYSHADIYCLKKTQEGILRLKGCFNALELEFMHKIEAMEKKSDFYEKLDKDIKEIKELYLENIENIFDESNHP